MENIKTADKYRFQGYSVDIRKRQVFYGGEKVTLTAKAFDTLVQLLVHRSETVSKGDLMNAVWSDSAVEENNLTQQIAALRRAFGERPNDHRFIVTVPGRGYRFVAECETVKEEINVAAGSKARSFDPAVLRGYSLAAAQILVVVLAFIWSAIAHSGDRPHSLAILNFKTASTGDEFIGSGISETLRARLGSVEDLVVRPALSERDAFAAGRRLNVDTVVTGSVQRDHERIRVVVEMVDVSDGRIVWGKTFDAASSNVFALQDTIAGEIARVLNVNISFIGRRDRQLA